MDPKNKILILLFHPLLHKSRVNRVLVNAVAGIEGVSLRNMYDLYPDFHIDIKEEQKLLLQYDIIIWQHPFYWYSSPSLMKEWLDLVLEHGFAYGREGRALEGKMVMSAITTGGRKEAYAAEDGVKFSIRQLLAPVEQTVELCNMDYLPPFVTHGTHLLNAAQIEEAGEHYGHVIRSLAAGTLDSKTLLKSEYMNDIIS
jgi:glutathione-regulated potassium-efflux system ancillary protein KefG